MTGIAILSGATCTGKTMAAIEIAKATGAVILPMDQLHRYAHLREGVGLDTTSLAEVDTDGYGILSPWEVSGPEKYIRWLKSTILRHYQRKPIVVEGGCTSYLRAVLCELEERSVLSESSVFIMSSTSKYDETYEHIRNLCTKDKFSRIVAEVESLENMGFIRFDALELFRQCENLFSHPDHEDRRLAWAIRISAKIYYPAFLALKNIVPGSVARERMIANAMSIHRYQVERIHEFTDRHPRCLAIEDQQQCVEEVIRHFKN